MDYRSIIESRYNRQNWQGLLHDIFKKNIQFWQQPQPVPVDSNMAKNALYIGKIDLIDGHSVAIYEVELADSVVIERNRTGIRNLLCTNWRGMGYAGAFMFCYRQNEAVLRFSYVSESYVFAKDGSLTKESTDTKRYTYLLGEGHRSRTAIDQFEKLKVSELTLKDITKAFSVEALSDQFFDGYKSIYEDIIEYITGKRMVKVGNKWEEKITGEPCRKIMDEFAKFDDAEKAVRDYVKKLMGRLVFIQFLQKKGWMGCSAGKEWNDGDKEFIQHLFENSDNKEAFVDDVLEPLFNDINTCRKDDLANTKLGKNIKIPYLNGGLFEMDEYDQTKFPLPSEYLKELFDFFASYNFTIDENDPDDAEIGVDPEMLGRIFENLLEDNKDKGAFYTPKEIVQYMCRESLIAYLQTNINDGLNKDTIRQFVTSHDIEMVSEDLKNTIDQNLKNVKICDPAIGSGAFPMGLLRELYACRKAIEGIDDDNAVRIKTEIIQNNIYGVDIEKGAIDIARLRFWLSIVVDLKTPHALPNFDYKFMLGDSLVTTFNGEYINLDTKNQKHVNVNKMREEKEKLFSFKQQFYESQGDEKHELSVEIKKSILRLIMMQLDYELESWSVKNKVQATLDFDGLGKENHTVDIKNKMPQDKQKLVCHAKSLYDQLNDSNTDIIKRSLIDIKVFDWKMMFSEIFDEENGKGGFDIVIGNPPYVDIKGMPKEKVKLYFKLFSTCENRINLYAIFIEKAMSLLAADGSLCYINPNSMLVNESYTKLRNLLLDKVSLIVKLPDSVFETAVVETIVFLVQNNKKSSIVRTKYFKNNAPIDLLSINYSYFDSNNWKLDDKTRYNIFISSEINNILSKVKNAGKPLSDYVLTSLGITPYDKAKGHTRELIESRGYHSNEQKDNTYVPLISGKNISPYSITSDVDEYLKYGEWLGAPRERKFFTTPRIVVRQIVGGPSLRIIAGYEDEKPTFFTQIGFSIISKKNDTDQLKFILAILNSRLISFYHKYMFLDIEKVVFQKVLIANAKLLPIKVPENITPFLDLVTQILSIKKHDVQADTSSLEAEVDRKVYELYSLTNEEVKIIDPNILTTGEDNDIFKA